jgi:hypothetical protein
MTNKNKINQILDMMDSLQENLLSLPDDMLLSIDPRDNESVLDGSKFIIDFNKNLAEFSKFSNILSEQIKSHFNLDSEKSEVDSESLTDSSNLKVG